MIKQIVMLSFLLSFPLKAESPMKQSGSFPVKDCPKGAKTVLPLITWGGDIATVLANGSSLSTTKDSLLGQKGLSFELKREDDFKEQVKSYMACKSPFLRGTLGMLHMASEITEAHPQTKLKIIYQLTWSVGGDALVVKEGIASPKDLKGKTIALQSYGPHVDYLGKVLQDAGLSYKDVKIKWVKDLTATKETPLHAFRGGAVDGAMMIIPDALAATSNGQGGTGAEDSVKGARILLSTKSASRIIADVYGVRSDYFAAHKKEVGDLVHGLMKGSEELQALMKKKGNPEYQKTMASAAKILLDSEQAIPDTEGLYGDARFVGFFGNKKFFADPYYPRSLGFLNQEIQKSLLSLGLIQKAHDLEGAGFDYDLLQKGMTGAAQPETGRFDKDRVAAVVDKRQKQNQDRGDLFAFEVFFQPNQNTFTASQYEQDFKRVINLASTYGGAIITVEGHSDPLGYLKKKKSGATNVVLQKIRQSAKNLSMTRANHVKNSLMAYAKEKGVVLDPSQFAVVGHGIGKPRSGMCSGEPCAPKTKQEWLDNMRVEFKIIQVEAEENVFSPI